MQFSLISARINPGIFPTIAEIEADIAAKASFCLPFSLRTG